MKLSIFSVFDSKASAFLPPFFLHNDAMAIRVFSDCVNADTHAFGKHPADYTLFRIGSFSDENGTLTAENPITLGNGLVHQVAGGAGEQLELDGEPTANVADIRKALTL